MSKYFSSNSMALSELERLTKKGFKVVMTTKKGRDGSIVTVLTWA